MSAVNRRRIFLPTFARTLLAREGKPAKPQSPARQRGHGHFELDIFLRVILILIWK
jgi:hypothetical protein